MKNMREVLENLVNSEESAYSIGQGSGVNASQIQRLRSGKINIDNISFKNAENLYNYAIRKNKKRG